MFEDQDEDDKTFLFEKQKLVAAYDFLSIYVDIL